MPHDEAMPLVKKAGIFFYIIGGRMINVLIADDDFHARNGLQSLLESSVQNANVVATCRNGAEVLNQVQAHQVDLIISDIKMPEMNGVEMSRQIHLQYPYIKIMLVSAYAEFEYAQKAMEYGVSSYILKPMTHTKVQQIIAFINQVDAEKESNNSFKNLVHDASFRALVKKAFKGQNIEDIKKILEVSNEKRVLPWDFYLYIISIFKEFLSETNAETCLDAEVLSRLELQHDPAVLKEFILSTYEIYKLYINGADNNDEGLISWVRQYVNRNFSSVSISTGEIAGLANISEAHLCRVFKRHEGITLTEYIVQRRMNEAKELLLNDALLMKEVAQRSGYENEKYFYTVFKRYVGVSPSRYKQMQKESEANAPKSPR